MMFKIGVDVRPTEEGFKAHYGRGTGRYARELTQKLVSLSQAKRYADIEIVPATGADLGGGRARKAVLETVPLGKTTLETQFFLSTSLKQLGVDLFHFFSHGDAPAYCSVPYVVTVLDLIPLRFPELYRADKPNWRFRFARHLERKAIQNARGVIAISEQTKSDVVELLGVEPDRIVVTPLAVSEEFFARDLESIDSFELEMYAQRAYFHLPPQQPVLLYVGGIDPRKNVTFLLEVFADVLARQSERGLTGAKLPVLVLAGPYEKDEYYPILLSDIERLGITDHVKLLGFLSDEKLRRLYHAANLSLFPSLYEGFGLPVLESLACGTPVIAGDNSSIPEVAGESAILLKVESGKVEPGQTKNGQAQYEEEHKRLWVQETIALMRSMERQFQMSVQGVERAKKFHWNSTAEKTLAAYMQFLGVVPSDITPTEQSRGRRTGTEKTRAREQRAALG